MKIKILTTGGTIDKVYFDAKSEYEVGPPQIVEILREAHVTREYAIESVLSKDSLDMTDDDRQALRRRVAADPCADRHYHGTDTMIQTALSLRSIPEKTIVLTGSMQPARFKVTDAVFNIGTAIGAVQSLPPGVYLAMNGHVFDPARVRKNVEENRFEEIDRERSSRGACCGDGSSLGCLLAALHDPFVMVPDIAVTPLFSRRSCEAPKHSLRAIPGWPRIRTKDQTAMVDLPPCVLNLGIHLRRRAVDQSRRLPDTTNQAFPCPLPHLRQRRTSLAVMVVQRLDRVVQRLLKHNLLAVEMQNIEPRAAFYSRQHGQVIRFRQTPRTQPASGSLRWPSGWQRTDHRHLG